MPPYDVSVEIRDAYTPRLSDIRRILDAEGAEGTLAYDPERRTFRYAFTTAEDISRAAARLKGETFAAQLLWLFFPGADQSQVSIQVQDAEVKMRSDALSRTLSGPGMDALVHRHSAEQAADAERSRQQSALIRRVIRQELADVLSDLADTLPSQSTALRDVERRLRNRLHNGE